MKKADWFIALIIIVLGLACLSISATSFGNLSLAQFSRQLGSFCIIIILSIVVTGWVYILWSRKYKG